MEPGLSRLKSGRHLATQGMWEGVGNWNHLLPEKAGGRGDQQANR